jgi:hypothetical protein
MSCPQCKTQIAKGAEWCKYCGEDITRSQHHMRYIYYLMIVIVLAALAYSLFFPPSRSDEPVRPPVASA